MLDVHLVQKFITLPASSYEFADSYDTRDLMIKCCVDTEVPLNETAVSHVSHSFPCSHTFSIVS